MKNRPGKSARSGRPAFTIFVPQGSPALVSQGVRALPMAPKQEPIIPRPVVRKKARPQTEPAPRGGWQPDRVAPRRSKSAASGGRWAGWQVPAHWVEVADQGGWEPEGAAADFLSPEILEQAEVAKAHWDMKVSDMTVMATKPEKGGAIWRIETDKGPRSLKLLHREPARSWFSVGLQDYLVQKGARVPALIPSKSGELAVEIEGKLWIVTDWIEQLVPASKGLDGAAALCYGLGEFHKWSQGYVPPPGAVNASRLYRWPRTYEKVLNKIGWFREIARAYAETPAAPTLLEMVDIFEQQARDALTRLQQSPYAELTARGEQYWGVVHQDYGWSNGQVGPGGIWIIDLDGVAYDLGIRDLRKLITSTMDDMGVWDVGWMRTMIEAYNEANPIEPDLMQVLLIDMSLPNEFYKHVKTGVTKTLVGVGRGYHHNDVEPLGTTALPQGGCSMNDFVLRSDGEEPVSMPTWDQVAQAIHSLDGLNQTLVSLGLPEGPSLMIGGGNGGRFLVDYLVNHDTQEDYVLTDTSLDGPDVELCVGGQFAHYAAQWCVPLSLALMASEHFYNTGSRAPQLVWVKG